MARYICPSCGAEFNGKKCKNCNYEALEWDQSAHPHPLRPEAKVHTSGSFPASQPTRPTYRGSRRRRKPKVLLIIIGIICAVHLLQYGMFLATRQLTTSHSSTPAPDPEPADLTVPEWDGWEIPSLSQGDYQLLYENHSFTIWADCQKMWHEGIIYLTVENRSDQDLDLFADYVVLNDQLCSFSSSLYVEAEAGNTGQGTFYLEFLEGQDVYPGKVSFTLYGFDAETYDTILETDFLELTAPGGEMVSIPWPEGVPMIDEEDLGMCFISWENPENMSDAYLRFGLVNDTDQDLIFSCDNATANGEYVTLPLSCGLPPHTIGYYDVYCWLLAEDLHILSADQLDSLTLNMSIYDVNSATDIATFPAVQVPLP